MNWKPPTPNSPMSKAPKTFVPDLFGGCTTPCAKCPYRKDAPLALWSREEFTRLMETEADLVGSVFGCHNNDATVCRGWFLDQRRRYYPSIRLRVLLATSNIDPVALEAITAPEGVDLFPSVNAMVKANFPRLKLVTAESTPSRGDRGDSTCKAPRARGKRRP